MNIYDSSVSYSRWRLWGNFTISQELHHVVLYVRTQCWKAITFDRLYYKQYIMLNIKKNGGAHIKNQNIVLVRCLVISTIV